MNLGSKKYPNINKYFNRLGKGFVLVLMCFYGFTGICGALGCITAGFGFAAAAISLIWAFAIVAVCFMFYLRQVNLEKARLGKHLKKYYGLEGDALVRQLEMIDAEVGRPVYADASKKKKRNAFFVTENWLVGTDGVYLARVNACKRSDIVSVDPYILEMTRKGMTTYYYMLKVADKNLHTYEFWLRGEDNMMMAHEFLTKDQGQAV